MHYLQRSNKEIKKVLSRNTGSQKTREELHCKKKITPEKTRTLKQQMFCFLLFTTRIFFSFPFGDYNVITFLSSLSFMQSPLKLVDFFFLLIVIVFTWINIYIPNKMCSVCIVLLLFMFSRMTLWHWTNNRVFFPKEGYISHSQPSLGSYHSFVLG